MSIRLIILMLFMSSKMLLGQLDTLVLEPTKDTYIKAILSGTATYTGQSAQNGLDSLLAIQKIQVSGSSPATYYVKRNLLQFDLDELPIGAVVTSAKLYLHKTLADSLTRYIKARMITQSWSESDVTWSEIATKTNSSSAVEQSYNHGDTMVFDLTAMLALWTCKNVNYGVMISPTADNQSGSAYNMPFDFFSREAMVGKRPKLNITYYLPINAVADITPASNSSSNDGAVEIIVGGGAGTGYSYQWYDSNFNSISTSKNLSSKVAGLYGLKITDGAGGVFRKMFIIPSESSSVTVTVRPGSEFGQDAYFTASTESSSQLKSGAVANLGLTNGTVSPGNKAEFVHHLDLDFDVLKGFEISNASVSYKQSNSIDTMMTTSVYNITSPWTEDCVCNGKRPTTGSTFASIASRTGSFPSLQWSVDLADHFNSLIEDDSGNFGFMFTPDSVKAAVIAGGGYTLNAFPSENSVSSNRPLFTITVNPTFRIKQIHQTVTASSHGFVKLVPFNHVGSVKYFWGDNFLENDEFDSLISTFVPDSIASYISYDTHFLTSNDSVSFESGSHGHITAIDSSGVYIGEYAVNDSLEYDQLQGYSVSNWQITRTAEDIDDAIFILGNGFVDSEGAFCSFYCDRNSGSVFYGFTEPNDSLIFNESKIKYGFEINRNKIFPIDNYLKQSCAYKTFDESKLLCVEITENKLYLSINGERIVDMDVQTDNVLLETVHLKKKNSILHFVQHIVQPTSKKDRIRVQIADASCDGSVLGSAQFQLLFHQNSGHTVLPNHTTYLFHVVGNNYNQSNNTGLFENLAPGQYSLQVDFNSSMSSISLAFDIGYEIDWNTLCTYSSQDCQYFQMTSDLVTNTNFNNNCVFVSKNKLFSNHDGWVEITLDCPWPSNSSNVLGMGLNRLDNGSSLVYSLIAGNPNLALMFSTNTTPVVSALNFPNNRTRFRIERSDDSFSLKCLDGNWQNSSPISDVTLNNAFAQVNDNNAGANFSIQLQPTMKFYKARSSFPCVSSPQAVLKRELDGGYHHVTDSDLKFKYFEEYNESSLNYSIYACSDMSIPLMTDVLPVTYGDNRKSIDVNGLSSGYYILAVTNTKDEKLYLRFFKY